MLLPKTAAALRDSMLDAVLIANPAVAWHDAPVMTPDFALRFRARRGPTFHVSTREVFGA